MDDSRHDEARHDARTLGLGLLIGAALGACAALLMAPGTGASTRRQLRRGARKLYERGEDSLHHLMEDSDRSARRFARRGLKRGRKLVEEARDTVGW